MNNNLFNIDLVGAKTGKKLTKYEKRLQYTVNLLASRLFQFTLITIIFLVIAIIVKGGYVILFNL